eukprot:superscaffoldBa00010346_g24660
MRILVTCMVLVLLSANVRSQPEAVSERYRKFINQHINADMSINKCDKEINKLKITKTGSNECKETNTFILATTNLVKSVCKDAGEPYNNLMKSTKPFPIIVCKLKGGQRRPHCEYRGQSRTRRIAIACEDGFPVHFDRDIVHFEN